ncbi:hypothetical protein SUGI_0409150 [Cryptomeria japonica]|nr:hypothetical protein SUGI_0409150 [Cryptomeria japonica]
MGRSRHHMGTWHGMAWGGPLCPLRSHCPEKDADNRARFALRMARVSPLTSGRGFPSNALVWISLSPATAYVEVSVGIGSWVHGAARLFNR